MSVISLVLNLLVEVKNMEHQPLFTIGIASYNYDKYIKRALNCIKRQNFTDYEILVSDDCSTDHSVDVVKQFIKENPNICVRLITSTKNEGVVANKNKLISNCRGRYLMLCDADDWMSKNCLEKFAQAIKDKNPDRIISQVAHIDQNGKIIQVEFIPENQTKWGWNLHHGSVYKTDILRQYDIKIKAMPDDVYFTIEFAKYCNKVIHINETLYYWLVHTDSEGRKKISLNREETRNIYGNVLTYITEIIQTLKNSNNKNYKRDIKELSLVRLKLYYFYILFISQRESLKNKLEFYNILHEHIIKLDKNYYKSSCLPSPNCHVLRSYPMKAIKLCMFLEQIHLMKLGLLGFHIISKFKYFDQ